MNFWKYIKNTIQDTSDQENESQEQSEKSLQQQKNQSQERKEETSPEQGSQPQEQNERSLHEQKGQSQERKEETSQEQESQPQEQSEKSSHEQKGQSQDQCEDSSQKEESQSQQLSDKASQEQENAKELYQNEEQSQEQLEIQDNEQQVENQQDISEDRKERLQQLRDKIQEYAEKKRKKEELQKQSLETTNLKQQHIESEKSKEYQLNEQTNHFLEQLSELPSFENRDKGPGYSIDTNSYTEIPDSIIKTLITKFLNQRFCKNNTDLNVRSNSLEKAKGFYKWEVKDVVTHLQTHQITKVLDDKYGYEYANGKNENVPLSFYFDMSGSMSNYTNMLSVIAIELLKKNVKVLIGFNERVNVQIDKIAKNIDVSELAKILESAGYYSFGRWHRQSNFKKDSKVTYKFIDKNLDDYLISKKAEKCVVFSDFDSIDEVINLSLYSDVYWFCFESNFDKTNLKQFKGFIYKVKDIKDLMAGLIKVNEKKFEALCYVDNPKTLQKK